MLVNSPLRSNFSFTSFDNSISYPRKSRSISTMRESGYFSVTYDAIFAGTMASGTCESLHST